MPNNPFIQYLCGLSDRKDRAALAHLRRGLGKPPGHAPEMFPYVVPFLPKQCELDKEDAYYLVASLFALHPKHENAKKSMGDTFKYIAVQSSDSKGPERRLMAMLNSHRDDLHGHLRHSVSLAKSKEVGINYEKLLNDLIYWDRESRSVQKQWAKDFWSEMKETSANSIEADEEAEKEEV